MKWMKKWPLSSLKVEMMLGVNLLNHTLAGPLSVVGYTLHIILFRTPCRCIRVLYVSRWSSRSFDSSYASTCGIRNLVRKRRKWLAPWRVSQFAGLVHPGWSIPTPSWRSSSCPSSFSSSACLVLCILHYSPIQAGSQCLLVNPACWGPYFLLDPPFLVDLLSGSDCRSALFVIPFVMLVVKTSFIPLIQLLLQLLVALGESFNCYG